MLCERSPTYRPLESVSIKSLWRNYPIPISDFSEFRISQRIRFSQLRMDVADVCHSDVPKIEIDLTDPCLDDRFTVKRVPSLALHPVLHTGEDVLVESHTFDATRSEAS